MSTCPGCGRELPANFKKFCPFCGTNIESTNLQVKDLDNIKGMPKMSQDETCVKTYHCAEMKGVHGYLTITNKRVIFHSYASTSSFTSKEILLDSVSGISCLRGRNYSIIRIILGVILAIVGLVMLSDDSVLSGLILIAIGALIVWMSIKNTYSLKIYSSKTETSPIDLGIGATSLLGNRALLSVACSPTTDTYKMINELGALILDLQTLGDHAINKWKNT